MSKELTPDGLENLMKFLEDFGLKRQKPINYSIMDLINFHSYCSSIKEPSDKIKTCIQTLEDHLHLTITSLQNNATKGPTQ
jgi:hypothetical protein